MRAKKETPIIHVRLYLHSQNKCSNTTTYRCVFYITRSCHVLFFTTNKNEIDSNEAPQTYYTFQFRARDLFVLILEIPECFAFSGHVAL